jgi:4-amino-4-deoxy-L-arabinose transferase-like glycosyltransferase
MKDERRILLAIVALGALLRLAAVVLFQHVPESDELAYQSMARNLVGGHGIVDIAGNRAMYNVGYPLLVLAPLYQVFGDGLLAPRLAHAVFGLAVIGLCWALARDLGAGRPGRLLAAAFAAVYLPFSVYGVYLFKENLMTPLMLALVWLTVRLFDSPSSRKAAGIGVLLGLLALVGNAALVLAVPILVAVLASAADLKAKVRHLGLIATIAVAVALPWAVRNLHEIGAPVLNTNGGFNLYLGNNPSATGMFMSIADTPLGDGWAALRRTGEVEASAVLQAEAIRWIRENPGRFVQLAFMKAAYFWYPPTHGGQGSTSRAEPIVRAAWLAEYVALVGLAVAAIALCRSRWQEIRLLVLSLVCFTGVHMVFYATYRYREPLMPLLCVLAALAAERLLAMLRDRGVAAVGATASAQVGRELP